MISYTLCPLWVGERKEASREFYNSLRTKSCVVIMTTTTDGVRGSMAGLSAYSHFKSHERGSKVAKKSLWYGFPRIWEAYWTSSWHTQEGPRLAKKLHREVPASHYHPKMEQRWLDQGRRTDFFQRIRWSQQGLGRTDFCKIRSLDATEGEGCPKKGATVWGAQQKNQNSGHGKGVLKSAKASRSMADQLLKPTGKTIRS